MLALGVCRSSGQFLMTQPQPESALLAIGTYTDRMPHVAGEGMGIHLLRFDAVHGVFGAETIVGGLRNPTYLAASLPGDRLYAVCEIDASEGPTLETYAVDPEALALHHLATTPIEGGWPCHVSLDPAARHLTIANYESGNFVVMALDGEGCPTGKPTIIQRQGNGPREDRQEAPHGHCALASPDGRYFFFVDLGTDSIARHPVIDGRVSAEPDLTIAAAPGAGPRHIAFSPSGRSLLAIHEMASTVTLHSTEDPEATLATVSTLPLDWTGENDTAAIRIHPNGRFVYASNRGHDSIFAAALDEQRGRLEPLGTWPAGGRTPRDIALTPDGAFLLAASQDEHAITVFAVDAATGALTPTGHRLSLKSPVCLCFIPITGVP
jgi:6-phosphogluconolactonase